MEIINKADAFFIPLIEKTYKKCKELTNLSKPKTELYIYDKTTHKVNFKWNPENKFLFDFVLDIKNAKNSSYDIFRYYFLNNNFHINSHVDIVFINACILFIDNYSRNIVYDENKANIAYFLQ